MSTTMNDTRPQMTRSTWRFQTFGQTGWTDFRLIEVPTGSSQALALAVFNSTDHLAAVEWLRRLNLGRARAVTWDE